MRYAHTPTSKAWGMVPTSWLWQQDVQCRSTQGWHSRHRGTVWMAQYHKSQWRKMRKWFRCPQEWWKGLMQDSTTMVRVGWCSMTQVPMLPSGTIQEPAKLVKVCSCWLHARHNSGTQHLAQEIILVPSQPYRGMTHMFWWTAQQADPIKMAWEHRFLGYDARKMQTPQGCPREEKCTPLQDASRWCRPLQDGTKKLQTPLGWQEEDADPSGMVCWLCRLLQYGTWKMQIPPGWQRMIKTPPGWYQMQIPLGRCKGAGDSPRQCRGCADSSGIPDDSDPSVTAQGRNRSFQNGRNADSPRASQTLNSYKATQGRCSFGSGARYPLW